MKLSIVTLATVAIGSALAYSALAPCHAAASALASIPAPMALSMAPAVAERVNLDMAPLTVVPEVTIVGYVHAAPVKAVSCSFRALSLGMSMRTCRAL